MSRETLTHEEFLRAVDAGRDTFLSCIFPEPVTLEPRSTVPSNNTNGARPIRLPGMLRFETCEFQKNLEMFDLDLESVTLKGSIIHGNTIFSRLKTEFFDSESVIYREWAGFQHTRDHIDWAIFTGARFKRGFLMRRFGIKAANMDNVSSPMSFFEENDFGEVSTLNAKFGRRTPVPLSELQ